MRTRTMMLMAAVALAAACGDSSGNDAGTDAAGSGGQGGAGGAVGSGGASGTGGQSAACLAAGGKCVTVSIYPGVCLTCDTGLVPATGTDPAMGCESDGVGADPWCCVPKANNGCVTAGGSCFDSAAYPCPLGWDPLTAQDGACGTGKVCCAPASCCASGTC